MKKNKTINRIAVKTGTPDGELFKTLLSEGLKLRRIPVEPGLNVYSMEDGTIMEFYGPGSNYPDYLFKYTNVVVGFNVENLTEMISIVQNEGAQLLGSIETVCNAFIYCHVLLSNKTVIGLYQNLALGK
ncbi:hypothetical protein [Pedobacter sp. Leaf194]|uniref:hypothetical protein n=1 Tax=Pedobacter sp. Leaf194 TaxID=1736297 RepID=UPI000702B2F0|nr:hypothetical protein [Pedobacter sp. Leaf194]KQS41779.1 hypothetical protein ASG14_04840 [Pedobacter sp. Leaf194]